MIVAIDGPAGAGKSSAARAAARALGFRHLDTGAMYRGVALALTRQGRPAADAASVAAAIQIDPGPPVRLDGEDVSVATRAPELGELASEVAADPEVRRAVVGHQRELVADGDWVAEGRDIGTVVAPGAELKLFLTASPAERARRRAAESGHAIEQVLEEIARRDERDRGRRHSPLRAAPDALVLDTTGEALEQVVARIVALVRQRHERARLPQAPEAGGGAPTSGG